MDVICPNSGYRIPITPSFGSVAASFIIRDSTASAPLSTLAQFKTDLATESNIRVSRSSILSWMSADVYSTPYINTISTSSNISLETNLMLLTPQIRSVVAEFDTRKSANTPFTLGDGVVMGNRI